MLIMMKKMMVLAMVLFIISSSQIHTVKSDAFDCYDACSTACVTFHGDDRLLARCDRKCSIRCGPDAAVAGQASPSLT